MALTLAPELLTAQTAQSRRPIIEVIAGRLASDYPFIGTPIAKPDDMAQGVSLSLVLPDGRFAVFYVGGSSCRELRLIVTDAAATEFSDYVVVETYLSPGIDYLDGFVMDGGNLAVVARLPTDVLALLTISPAGVKISETQLTSLETLAGASVCKTSTGYALVYFRVVGGVYTPYIQTSIDFISWGSASAISIADLDSSHPLKDPRIYQLADGTYILVYSYATVLTPNLTVYNLQYSTSSNLTTWTASESITDTTEISEDYVAPSIVQREDGSLFIAVQESNTYLTLTTADDGWDTTSSIGPTNLWVDEAAGKLYLTTIYSGVGSKNFMGMCRIDIPTWTVDQFYDLDTTPAVPAVFGSTTTCLNVDQHGIRDGYASLHSSEMRVVSVVDYNTDTVRTYYFDDLSGTYGGEAAQNVTHDVGNLYILSSDVYGGKLWLGFVVGSPSITLGYIDLTQTTPPYEFIEVNIAVTTTLFVNPKIFFYGDDNIALVCCGQLTPSYTSHLHVLSLTSSAIIKSYCFEDYPEYPQMGTIEACLVGGNTVYAVPHYNASIAADAHKWGLMQINLNNDAITYYQPPWITTPGDHLNNITTNESANEVFFRTTSGVVVFNYVSKTWEQLENDAVEGLPPTDTLPYTWAGGIAYDSTRECFFYGDMGQVYLVPRNGAVTSIKYITEDEGVFSDPAPLVTGYHNVSPSITLNADDEIFATWTNTELSSVCWDKAGARLELSPYLTGETALEWAIDAPGRLTFTLASGHLFDPRNDNSVLKTFLTKAKGVVVRIGDNVDGTEYWADQGTYIVRSLSLSYQRGQHPLAKVVCEDLRSLWSEHQVVVANIDMQSAEDALSDLITENTNILSANISVPTLPLSFSFDAQWINAYLGDMVENVATRFQHFCTVGHDGIVTFRPISVSAASVNTHSSDQTINYTPDDSYSDLTNRITVTGKSLYDFQETYAEERLASLSGTVGWWGYNKDKYVYYSDDKSKRAKNPRLKVIETSTSIPFKLEGQITEKISVEDPEFKYCVVEIKAPDLTAVLATAIAIYVAGNVMGDGVIGYGVGKTIPIGRKIEGVGLLLAMMVLGSVGNYQYEIWGNPVGYQKRSYSESSDDEDLQQELGMVVEAVEEGFLCHTPAHCQTDADFRAMVAKAQRNRISIKKTANLQDEIGDTVTVAHPYTGHNRGLFITNLARRYKPSSGNNDGYVNDDIEGWAV